MSDENLTGRRTGGAGVRTHPLSDDDYRREMDKLAALNAADSEGDQE